MIIATGSSGRGTGSSDIEHYYQLTDFARVTLFDSDSDCILDTVASPERTQAWDLYVMGKRLSFCTNGTGQSRTTDARNQVFGVGSATLSSGAEGNIS